LDLGANSDDALSAAMVQTLTGGGDADSLHTHAASGGGGACYTVWGTTSCGAGHTQIYSGQSLVPRSLQGSTSNFRQEGGIGSTICVDISTMSFQSISYTNDTVWTYGKKYQSSIPCALCCQ